MYVPGKKNSTSKEHNESLTEIDQELKYSFKRNYQDGKPLRHLKLLRPDDTLHIGQVYRLISFEDVLKEFAAKKCVKLGKLLKETAGLDAGEKTRQDGEEVKEEMEPPPPTTTRTKMLALCSTETMLLLR